MQKIKSWWVRRRVLAQIQAESRVKLKENIKQHLFYVLSNINLEIAHYELVYIYQMENDFLEAELLKDREKIEAACRASLMELEKIIIVKEDYLLSNFIESVSALITKVKYRNWSEHMGRNRDTHGALGTLADEIKLLLKHDIPLPCK